MRHFYPWEDFQAATTIKLAATETVATLSNLDTKYVAAVNALIHVDAGPVRVGYGGYTPNTTTGHLIDRNDSFTLKGWDEMKYFRYIRGGGTDAVMWVTYKYPKGAHPRG